jgi:hypothetical protein
MLGSRSDVIGVLVFVGSDAGQLVEFVRVIRVL